jgi:glycosyltransferase involved in cell wall biosynthesis
MGVGAATRTGFEVAKQIDCDVVVTFDADGQHSPIDIERVIQPIMDKQAEFVIGSRLQSTAGMPAIKIFGNWLMNFITYSVFRQWSTDSQSGLKAISRRALDSIKLQSTGYEICSELIGEIRRNKLTHKEIPIQTIYTDYSKLKGQDMFNAINIFTRIIYIKLGSLK